MAWTQSGNIKGPKGDPGNPGADSTVPGPPGDPGDDGAPGARGSKWFTGTGAPAGVTGSVAGDMYLDTASGNVYELA